MLWNSTSDQVIAQTNLTGVIQDDARRRQDFEARHLLLAGDFRELVKARVRERFTSPTEADRVGVQADSSCNVFGFVTSEIAQFRGAKRAFRSGDTRDEVYARLEEEVEPFDMVMQEIVTTLHGCNDGLIRVLPGVVQRDGTLSRPSIRVFKPHECTVIAREDDPSQPQMVAYESRTPTGELVTVVWTEDEHYVVGSKGDIRYAAGAVSSKNSLGRIPFVAFHNGLRPDVFWDESTGKDRVEFTLDYLAGWSAVNYMIHMQSHKQMKATGNMPNDWAPPSKTGPGFVWKVRNGDIEVLDLQSDPSNVVAALERGLAGHMASQGLNPDGLGQNPGQAPPSGLSLYLDRHKVIERRRKMHPAIIEAEYALAEIFRWAWNIGRAPVQQIDPAAKFEAELIEETVVQSPEEVSRTRKEKLAVYKLERELGLKSPVEQLAEDRGISPEEAEEVHQTLTARPEIFAYDAENALVTIDENRSAKGLPPHPNREIGVLTLPELRDKHPSWFATATTSTPKEPE